MSSVKEDGSVILPGGWIDKMQCVRDHKTDEYKR